LLAIDISDKTFDGDFATTDGLAKEIVGIDFTRRGFTG